MYTVIIRIARIPISYAHWSRPSMYVNHKSRLHQWDIIHIEVFETPSLMTVHTAGGSSHSAHCQQRPYMILTSSHTHTL